MGNYRQRKKDIEEHWTEKQLLEDYDKWQREFLDYGNAVDYRDVSSRQQDYILYCNNHQLQNLIDVRPAEDGSSYIRSSTEPFDQEMRLDESRVSNWLEHFSFITSKKQWNHTMYRAETAPR